MKNKDVILDFTSLLDIVLLILFFFILYSAFNVQEAETRADAARAAYEQELGALQDKKAGLEEERARLRAEGSKLRTEWERVLALDENAGRNQQALIAFDQGAMLAFNLQKEDDSDAWTLNAVRKSAAEGEDETVGTVRPGDDLYGSIVGILDSAGYGKDDVLIITFTYNGNVIGTHRLYVEIMKAFRAVQKERKNVYLTAINVSK